MATRYLQSAHPSKHGKTSDDGRSIWNGFFKARRALWDITSSGTGATYLNPATSKEKRFFQADSRDVSYGFGRAVVSEGIRAALFSEMLHKRGIRTERTLAIIQTENGSAVNVRAGKNLLRPAHFFGFLKRNEHQSLKDLADYYIEREQVNGNFPDVAEDKYTTLLSVISKRFARAAAVFESEYLFYWMDWDGDNILMDGGIIDYGSVRQFGLFHHHYHYIDGEKMSTSITEQKNKAKQIVQTFAQIIDYLQTGNKKAKKHFKSHWSQDLFEQVFQVVFMQQTLRKIGFEEFHINTMLADVVCYDEVQNFQQQLRYFEKAVAARKEHAVADGIMRDAIFCMRDFLREFPAFYLQHERFMSAPEFISMVSSDYASQIDRAKYRRQSKRIENLQKTYLKILEFYCDGFQITLPKLLGTLKSRVAIINQEDKLTGHGISHLTDIIVKEKSRLSNDELHSLIAGVIDDNTLNPEYTSDYGDFHVKRSADVDKLLDWGRKKRDKFRQTI